MMMFIGTETLVWPGCGSPVGGLVTHEVVVVVVFLLALKFSDLWRETHTLIGYPEMEINTKCTHTHTHTHIHTHS